MKLLFSLLTFLTVSFSLSAQTDPLAEILKDVYKPSGRPQVSATPAMRAKLVEAQKEVKDQNLTFTVGITEASGRPMEELCGSLDIKPVSEEALNAQDEFNAKIIKKAEEDMKKRNIPIPKLSGVSAGPSVSATPSSFFAGTALPPIRNQGGCGSCWAFAACAAYETAFRKWYGTNRNVDMSEQDLVDCGKTYILGFIPLDAGSCSGGYTNRALDYIKCYGTTTESNRPYVARNQDCAARPKKFYAWCWGQLGTNIQKMKDVIYGYGSIVTSVQAQGSFMNYTGGIINYRTGGHNHAITIVGWNDAYQAWIVRNSWGTSWGYNGYGYIRYDACNIGQNNYWIYPYNAGGGVSASASAEGDAPPQALEESPLMKGSN
jgi:cathepsin L